MRGTFDRRRVRRESLPEDDLRHPAPTQAHGQAASSGDARCDDILRTTSSKVYLEYARDRVERIPAPESRPRTGLAPSVALHLTASLSPYRARLHTPSVLQIV